MSVANFQECSQLSTALSCYAGNKTNIKNHLCWMQCRWSATKNVPWLFFNNDNLWTSHNCGEVLFIVNLEHTYAIIKKKRQQKMTTEEVTRKVWNRSQKISWYETISFILVSIIRRTSFRKPRRHVKPLSRIVMLLLSLFFDDQFVNEFFLNEFPDKTALGSWGQRQHPP